jgi:hypothetical protein
VGWNFVAGRGGLLRNKCITKGFWQHFLIINIYIIWGHYVAMKDHTGTYNQILQHKCITKFYIIILVLPEQPACLLAIPIPLHCTLAQPIKQRVLINTGHSYQQGLRAGSQRHVLKASDCQYRVDWGDLY